MKVILYQPQIPQNTGNIVRTCKATNSTLTLVKPLGFSTSSRMLKQIYTEVEYAENSILIFGSETTGLPSYFHEKWKSHFVKIPMRENARCLNLSNTVAIGIYEICRQNPF